MPDAAAAPAWMTAWLNVQQQLSQFATDPARRLMEFGNDYTGIAADLWGQMQAKEPDFTALQAVLVERYRRLFMPVAGPAAASAETGAAFIRSQHAAERLGRHISAIAIDASERLTAALAATGPDAAPITSLRELHGLWIECGEASYAAAAHREDFADAQAELLASFVELRVGQLRR